MKKSNKNQGFTLIEVLATILIISIVFGASYYFTMNTINNSKEKSKEISINSIKTSARTYSKEYPNNLIWKEDGENHYACVTIQDLINAGYYKEEQINNIIDEKYKSIILTKNNSNTIISEELDESGSCSLSTTQYTIRFNGNGKTSGKVENVTCTRGEYCTLNENKFIKTGHKFMGWAISANGNVLFDDNEKVKDIAAKNSSLVTLYAVWKPNNIYIRYHTAGGDIKPETTDNNGKKNKWTTIDDGLIRKNDKFYHTTKYGETLDDGLANYNNKNYIYITKPHYHIESQKEWCTKINGEGICYNQETKLTNIGTGNGKNQLCNAKTDDCTIDLYLNWKINRVYIKINKNGGNLKSKNNTYKAIGDKILKNNSENIHTIEYGSSLSEKGLINWNNSKELNLEKKGFKAIPGKEWNTQANGKGKSYNQEIPYNASEFCDTYDGDCTITLYVNWREDAKITCQNKTYNGRSQIIASCSGGTLSNHNKINAGSYTVTCTGDANHNTVTKSCSIYKANASITCENKTYNGSLQTIASCSGGTLSNHNQTNAGSYTVTCTGDSNHNTVTKSCSIEKASSTITCENKTYNGRSQTIASCSGGTLSNHNKINAGSYTVTCTGDSNHTTTTNSCSISKASSTITCQNKTYNGKSQTIASCSGGTLSNHNKINAGSYTVTCRGDSNHTTTTKSCSIAKANASITCENKTYNGKSQTIASCSGGTPTNSNKINAGSYIVKCIGDSNHNNATDKTCKINKAKASITCKNKLYDGSKQTIASCSGGKISNHKHTKVGKYTVKCTGDSNHTNADSKTCKISESDAKITFSPNGGSYESPKSVSVSCSAKSGVSSFTAEDNNHDSGTKSGNTITIILSSTGSRSISATCTSKGGGKTKASKSFTITSPPSSGGTNPGSGSTCHKEEHPNNYGGDGCSKYAGSCSKSGGTSGYTCTCTVC